jgi:hypothetical protein
MQKMWYFTKAYLSNSANSARLLLCVVVVSAATVACASVPDWLRQVARAPLPVYSDDTDAVVLLEETTTTVSPSGEVHCTFRKAYKILRPQGRNRGTVRVYFDAETRLTFLKAWSIDKKGEDFEVKEGDAVETAAFSEGLYADTRQKFVEIPAATTGSVIGYEYQQRARSSVLQSLWMFQDEIPVRRARFVLELAPNWKYVTCWRNHPDLSPQSAGENRWMWELTDIDAIRSEPKMPSWRSVAGEMGISFSPKLAASSSAPGAWSQIGSSYESLITGRRDTTAEIKSKTRQLVEGVVDPYEKLRRLTSYVQHEIRYVAIEIGIGGYQPHFAADVFSNRYGDCKDKTTLLSAMLHEAGFDSYYVLINDERDFLSPEFPSLLNFNHVILAVRLPQKFDPNAAFATISHKKLGTLIFFDPTDPTTPLGYLPPSLQANYGLLVNDGGELLQLPVLPPSTNQIVRTARLTIDVSGKVNGTVQEIRRGPAAAELREQLLAAPKIHRQTVFQSLVSGLSDGAVLTSATVTDLGDFSSPLIIEYAFTSAGYAQHPGQLFLFRPCVLGHKGDAVLDDKPRQNPVIFPSAAYQTDAFEISLPPGYAIDELPHAVQYESSFATYKSELRADGHTLHYSREYEVRTLRVPLEELSNLKEFFRTIAQDERAFAFLIPSSSPTN